MRVSRILIGVPMVAALFFAACGDDDASNPGTGAAAGSSSGGEPNATEPAVCEVLGTLCHDADSGPGKIGDCHELGHVGNETACHKEFSSCITACVADEPGAGGAPSETVSNPYCQALGELCHFLEDEGTPTGECHELGHVGNEPKCVERFDACVPLCLAKRESEPDGHEGVGGAGGDAHGSGGEPSHAEGGTGGAH